MEIRERVKWLLKNYHAIKRHLNRLNFEIKRFQGLSYEQVIEALNFATPEGERVQTSNISDKPGRLSLMYRDYADKLNSDVVDLAWEYHTKKSEMEVLEYCITLIEPKLSQVITDMFINKMAWREMGRKYNISETTLTRYRKRGIAEIAKVFDVKNVSKREVSVSK